MHYTQIEIDTKQFIQNIATIKQLTAKHKANIKYCLPIKANAYGHGLVDMAKTAQQHIDYFGVASVNEGIILRTNNIKKPILVFGAFLEEQISNFILHDLEITISSLYKAKIVAQYCQVHSCIAKIHIKVDTGMNRIGVRISSSYDLIDFVLNHNCFKLLGVYSHLSNSSCDNDDYTINQISDFKKIATYVKNKDTTIICHLANSGGVINYIDSYFDMIRPGILSYGYAPDGTNQINNLTKSCLSLKSKVVFFKVVDKDQFISYGKTYQTKVQTRIVTIPIGYGDGYKRALSNIGSVLINGYKYKIAGLICMDMLMVDIGPNGTANNGDEVVLIGKQGDKEILLEDVAKLCNTISYEILCGFNERIARIYI